MTAAAADETRWRGAVAALGLTDLSDAWSARLADDLAALIPLDRAEGAFSA